GRRVLQALRIDRRQACAGQTRCDRHASGSDESRRRNRFRRGRRQALGDTSPGDVRHRRADGGDEHPGGWLAKKSGAMKIEINNGRLIDPRDGIDKKTSLFIAAGKVAAIGSAPPTWHANRVIDAAGMVVCPGLIDISARLREPGFEYKATLESELQAAIAGGVTSLACPPDTDPPLDEPGLVEMLKHRARSLNLAHVYPIGALTAGLKGETITEMGELTDAGCIAFSHADAPLADTQVLLRAMQYAATFGYRVWLRPQDAHLSRGGVAHDGEVAMRLGLPAIPACAETIALGTIFGLARVTGSAVHLARLSTHEGVACVRDAKRAGLAVTCDVAINHLH